MSLLGSKLAAALFLGICLCIGCGSAGSSKQPKRTEVRVAVSRASLLYLPVFVAAPAGCFEKHELAVNIEQTEAAPKSLAALLAGTVDVVAGGYLQVLDLVAQGRRLRAFLLMQQFPGFAALALPRASMPIRTIEDVKGMKVGVSSPGSESHRILNYILLQHGVRPEDVSVVGLGPSVTSFQSLERGRVDVLLAQGIGISLLARRHPDLRILFDTRTPALTRAALGAEKVPESVLIAQENWLNSNPDTARPSVPISMRQFSWS
jgi:NitT/TauT family transport system substrate-binding protein